MRRRPEAEAAAPPMLRRLIQVLRRPLLVPLAFLIALVATASATARPDPPLAHQGRWFVDQSGRVVILHGLNMVYKVGSYRPADSGFGADDAKWLRRHGFNTVRLGIIYKGLEPNPPSASGKPAYRKGYLRSIAGTEAQLAKQGVYTLLDFHQDLYNERYQGEGWPDWQLADDGLPSEPQAGFPGNYLVNQGLNRAFDSFWQNRVVDGRGLQDAYAAAWRRVASKFRGDPYVVGYDLLNEPWPGTAFNSDACLSTTGCTSFDSTTLEPFYDKVIAAIRGVDPGTLVFYEPLVTFDFGADTRLPDTGDPDAGISYHVYCLPGSLGGPGSGPACEPLENMALTNADHHADATGDVPFLTEFGATDDLETIGRIVRLADDHMVVVAGVALLRLRRPHDLGAGGRNRWSWTRASPRAATTSSARSSRSSSVPIRRRLPARRAPTDSTRSRAHSGSSTRPGPRPRAGPARAWLAQPRPRSSWRRSSIRTATARTRPAPTSSRPPGPGCCGWSAAREPRR